MVNRSSVCISPSSSFWTVETLVPQLPSTFPVLQLHRGALFRINTAEWPVLSRPDASLDAKRVQRPCGGVEDGCNQTKTPRLSSRVLCKSQSSPRGKCPRTTQESYYWIGDAGISYLVPDKSRRLWGHIQKNNEKNQKRNSAPSAICFGIHFVGPWTRGIGWRNYSGPVEPCRSWDGPRGEGGAAVRV
jgi:hypothetical protein